MDQKIATLNSSISLKANQSDLDVVVVTLNMKADHEEVVASLSLKADQSELDSALSSVDSRIDGVDGLLGTKANQSALDTLETRASVLEQDLTSNASRVSVLETNLSDNSSRVSVLEEDLMSNIDILHGNLETLESNIEILHGNVETLTSNIEILHGNVETLSSNIEILHVNVETLTSNTDILHGNVETLTSNTDILHGNVETIESNISILHGNVETLSSNIEILYGNVETLSSNIDILHGNVETLTSNIDILHGNVETLESNIEILHGNVETLESNIEILHGNVETLTNDIASSVSRIATIEGDYVTTNELVAATAATAAGAGFLTAGSVIFSSFNNATQTTTSKTLGDHFDELEDLYNANEEFNMETFVQKPTDFSSVPLPQGTTESNLKLYTQWKVDRLKEGRGYGTNDENSYLKVRDASVSFDGNRIGTQKIEFLRTTVNEAFGANECADCRLTTDSSGNFDVYRKATHPTLGSLYDGNVIEFKVDGDIKIKKAGGLFIDDEEVATIQEVTDQVAPVDQTASQLVTLTNAHGTRITDLEDAGYVTSTNLTNTLSTYATASSLGTTNTTVGDIDTRLATVENSGYVTASGLSGYNFATEGCVQTALDDYVAVDADGNLTHNSGSFRVGNANGTGQPQFFVLNEVNTAATDVNDRALVQLKAGNSEHNGSLIDMDDDDAYATNGNNHFVFKVRTIDDAIGVATDADTKFVIRPDGRVLINHGSTYQLTGDPRLAVNGDTRIDGDLTVSGTITGTVSGTISQADNVKIDDAGADTTNYLAFTRNSTAGYQRLYKDTSLKWNSTDHILYVLGEVRVNDGISHNGDTNTKFWFPSNDTAVIRTAGSDRVYVNSSGDVGINTSSPLGRLHVNGGTGDCRLVVQADTNNSGEGDNPTVLFVQDGLYRTGEVGTDSNNGLVYRSYGDQIWYSSSIHSNSSNTALKDNQTERMRLTDGGRLGVGKSSPAYPLDVSGTARADSFMTDYEYKTQDATVMKHGGVLAMDQFTWRRVVPQRFSGHIVWTPAANDHAAFAT